MRQFPCRTYGPGRLPYAERRDVGAGFAMVGGALLAGLVWIGGALFLMSQDVGDVVGFYLGAGVVTWLFAIPAAFVTASLLWRYAYNESSPKVVGTLFGALTAFVSLLVGVTGFLLVVVTLGAVMGAYDADTSVAWMVATVPFIYFVALLLAGWLVVPIGALCGWFHERSKLQH